MHPDDKHPSPEQIDKIITAEIPNADDVEANLAVETFMMHGPCGIANPNAPCMVNGKCSKHYPKKFYSHTTVDEDGFLVYMRRDNGNVIKKKE